MSRRDDIAAKIAARVQVVHGPLSTPCHIWTGPTSGDKGRGRDYPRMWLDGQTVAVHKVAWTNEHGYIPGKMTLDHICHNRRCVNERHLEMVTNKVNNERRAEWARLNKET